MHMRCITLSTEENKGGSMIIPKDEYDLMLDLMELDYYEDCARVNLDILDKNIFKLSPQEVREKMQQQLTDEGVNYESIDTN